MSITYVGLGVLTAKAAAAVREAVAESAEDLVGQAMDRTPVDTGTLRASIHVAELTANGSGASAKVATGGEANEYAVYVHEGTSRMSARPFLAQALLDNAGVYAEAMARAARGAF